MSPITGTIALIRNHRKNELPFIRPMTPPARPKKKAMIRYAMSPPRAASEEDAQRPDHRDDRDDHDDDAGDGSRDPDDQLEEDVRRYGEDQRSDDAPSEGGSGLLFHAPMVLPPTRANR